MSYERRVTFGETDLGGLMHFSEYPRLIEEAWTVHTSPFDLPDDLVWRQSAMQIVYQAPLHYRDTFHVSLQPNDSGPTLLLEFVIAGPQGPVASGTTTLTPLRLGTGNETLFEDAISNVIETEHTQG